MVLGCNVYGKYVKELNLNVSVKILMKVLKLKFIDKI